MTKELHGAISLGHSGRIRIQCMEYVYLLRTSAVEVDDQLLVLLVDTDAVQKQEHVHLCCGGQKRYRFVFEAVAKLLEPLASYVESPRECGADGCTYAFGAQSFVDETMCTCSFSYTA